MQSDDTVLISLWARDGSVRAYTLVDATDADWVNQWRWSMHHGYAVRTQRSDMGQYTVALHRELLGLTHGDGIEGDHISRVPLDNRRNNLRIASHLENTQNKGTRRDSASGHRGVFWDAQRKRYRAVAIVNGKRTYFGEFANALDAAEAVRAGRLRTLPGAID